MTHLLPPHADLALSHSSLQSALQIDPNQQQQPPNSSRNSPPKHHRKHPPESAEKSKKIKCDSKHPRCTACATAGTQCHQEDRHRQTLTPRGHTERIERQLLQCAALLKRHIPGFDLNNLDDILVREGIEIDTSDNALSVTFQFTPNSPQAAEQQGFPLRSEGPPPPMGGSPPEVIPILLLDSP
ncbi:hypothetical protein A0H81_07493 [Grifola frondosa]|uniref:Zn(2)-C6 fungal-type domain-containing protein n=1 Tax=Grifola frondosa TaxID=5627 RepID=A0A1C7M6T3_GRIFR|nr:hypothetical protein A0H81_07493 [Grifola frondosa]